MEFFGLPLDGLLGITIGLLSLVVAIMGLLFNKQEVLQWLRRRFTEGPAGASLAGVGFATGFCLFALAVGVVHMSLVNFLENRSGRLLTVEELGSLQGISFFVVIGAFIGICEIIHRMKRLIVTAEEDRQFQRFSSICVGIAAGVEVVVAFLILVHYFVNDQFLSNLPTRFDSELFWKAVWEVVKR